MKRKAQSAAGAASHRRPGEPKYNFPHFQFTIMYILSTFFTLSLGLDFLIDRTESWWWLKSVFFLFVWLGTLYIGGRIYWPPLFGRKFSLHELIEIFKPGD